MAGSIQWVTAEVISVTLSRPGLQELACRLEPELEGTPPPSMDAVTEPMADAVAQPGGDGVPKPVVNAINYTELLGELTPGDRVWLNLKALDLRLGTGGVAFVVAPLNTSPKSVNFPKAPGGAPPVLNPPAWAAISGPTTPPVEDSGYLVKARYTPLQVATRGVDSQHSPHHSVLAQAESLEGMPVVVADLHSSLPAICAAVQHDAAAAGKAPLRIAYVMTDGAALPLAFSRTVAQLVASGGLTATVTVGQAFGGDYEAVSLHSGLLAARHVAHADLAICIQGPGNLGTDTRWGFSGVAVGEAVNAAVTLGGRAVGCLRVSGQDPRPRHRGLSHHSLTAYGMVALVAAELALPQFTGTLAGLGQQVAAAAQPLAKRHRLVEVSLDGLDAVLATTPGLSTMGRGYSQDPAAFLAAAAAGRLALMPPSI